MLGLMSSVIEKTAYLPANFVRSFVIVSVCAVIPVIDCLRDGCQAGCQSGNAHKVSQQIDRFRLHVYQTTVTITYEYR